MATPIAPPTLVLAVDDLVDWLELTAVFDKFGVARLEDLLGSLLEQQETSEDNIGERDRQREQLIESLENEVEFRRKSLPETYPFELSPSGGELIRASNWREHKFCFYLVCLVATHVAGSELLRLPSVGALQIRLRNRVFQIIATLGLAGLAQGPAFSVGWPRQNGETIVQLLTRAVEAGGGFNVRNPPGSYISPQEKDGGIDVIAWTAGDRPPPTALWFGQTASGKNWPGKPVADHARVFITAYMLDATGNRQYATLIPYRVLDTNFWQSQNLYHYSILDRSRLPLRAWQGAQLAIQGMSVDDADNLGDLTQWIDDFLAHSQAA